MGRHIEIEKKEMPDYYKCDLIMVYDHYRINQELESRGIKKRIRLFRYLDGASRGKITFIDELDSNINDVYLDKLIEFFMYYSEVWLLRAFFLHMDGQILVRLNFGLLELKESLNNTTY